MSHVGHFEFRIGAFDNRRTEGDSVGKLKGHLMELVSLLFWISLWVNKDGLKSNVEFQWWKALLWLKLMFRHKSSLVCHAAVWKPAEKDIWQSCWRVFHLLRILTDANMRRHYYNKTKIWSNTN